MAIVENEKIEFKTVYKEFLGALRLVQEERQDYENGVLSLHEYLINALRSLELSRGLLVLFKDQFIKVLDENKNFGLFRDAQECYDFLLNTIIEAINRISKILEKKSKKDIRELYDLLNSLDFWLEKFFFPDYKS